jgi:hypothetical protein
VRSLRSLVHRTVVDPHRPHLFRATNEGYRTTVAVGGSDSRPNAMNMLSVRPPDPARLRCEAPGCGRLRDDPSHEVEQPAMQWIRHVPAPGSPLGQGCATL